MTGNDFSLLTFLDELDRRGGDLTNWPPLLRAEAETLLVSSAEARANFAAMQKIEAALGQTRHNWSPASGAVAARAMQHTQNKPNTIAVRRLSWAAAGTVALALGLFVGALPVQSDAPADIVAAALDQSDGYHVQ